MAFPLFESFNTNCKVALSHVSGEARFSLELETLIARHLPSDEQYSQESLRKTFFCYSILLFAKLTGYLMPRGAANVRGAKDVKEWMGVAKG